MQLVEEVEEVVGMLVQLELEVEVEVVGVLVEEAAGLLVVTSNHQSRSWSAPSPWLLLISPCSSRHAQTSVWILYCCCATRVGIGSHLGDTPGPRPSGELVVLLVSLGAAAAAAAALAEEGPVLLVGGASEVRPLGREVLLRQARALRFIRMLFWLTGSNDDLQRFLQVMSSALYW